MRFEYGKGLSGLRIRNAILMAAVSAGSIAAGTLWSHLPGSESGSVIGMSALGLGTMSVSAYLADRLMRGPARQIESVRIRAATIAAGFFGKPGTAETACEAGGLVDDFNRMSEKLEATVSGLRTLAYQDAVTGLPNRTVLGEVMKEVRGISGGAVISIDLDSFNEVNMAFGHQSGDSVLRQAASRMMRAAFGRNCVEDAARLTDLRASADSFLDCEEMLFRFAADEFIAVVLRPVTDAELSRIASAIVRCLSRPFELGEAQVNVGGSVGIARIGRDSVDPEELTLFAERAMKKAKKAGGGRYEFFDEKLRAEAVKRARLEKDFEAAVEGDQLVVHFQPKVSIRDGEFAGVEALIRWQHPSMGLLYPGDFLSIAEDKGLMTVVGRKVFQLAARQILEWQRRGLWTRVAINVCPTQFMNVNFAQDMIALAKKTGVMPTQIILEITEGVPLRNVEAANEQLDTLKRAGFRIALDDFGTGYCNLDQLRRVNFDCLKLDRSMIAQVHESKEANAAVEFAINCAHNMNKKVVAEGVETLEQYEELARLGCDFAQGYLLGRPMTAEQIVDQFGLATVVPIAA